MRRMVAGCLGAALLLTMTGRPVSAADPEQARDPVRSADRPARERLLPDDRRALHDSPISIQSAPGSNGLIVYSRSPYLSWPSDTWAMNGSGTGQSMVRAGGIGQGDNLPAWSPGGTMIAFTRDTTASTTDAAGDIYVMRQDGSEVRRLTATSAAEYSPSWSPDGARIAFSSNRSGSFEIYTMRIDGSDVRRITTNVADDYAPSWSPDGTRIAFHSYRSGSGDIYTMTPSGENVARITASPAFDLAPNWSPSGSKIAFASDRAGDFDIYTVSANGSGVANVTNDPSSFDLNPSWSPDGSLIVYDGDPYSDLDVLAVPATGGTPELLTIELDDEWSPDWQPIPAFPLVDARFSTFNLDIEWLFDAGITLGCSSERYCPDGSVTRGQMASFLARALDLPAATADYFDDDDGTTHEVDINRIAAAGITSGCSSTTYCPLSPVTRGQMAAFLHRALE